MAYVKRGRVQSRPSLSRAATAPHIKTLIQKFYAHKNFSSHFEVGVVRHGSYQADIISLNMKRHIIIIEVKSCWSDFATDNKKGKWRNYLKYCDQFYFAFTSEVWDKVRDRVLPIIQDSGAGVILVPELATSYRSVHIVKPARKDVIDDDTRLWLLTKLACKAGQWN
jgi:hypothetical protein